MKKTIAWILTLCMVLALVPVSAAHNHAHADETCDHEGTGTYTFTIEANCSAEGIKQVFCQDCEEVISEEVLAKNDNHFFYNGICMLCRCTEEELTCDHEVTYTFTIEANCSAEGLKTVICADCEEVISEEVLAKNDNHFFYNGVCMLCGESDECKHTYEVVKTLDASCTLPAYVWEKCTKCGNEKNGEVGAPNPKAHTYEVVKSLDATCNMPAYVWYECSECGAEKNGEVGEATGKHTYEAVKTLDATCTMPAYVWYECSVCGAEKNGEVGAPNPKAHTYEVVKSLDATCIEPAYVWYKCSECGAEKNGEVGEATGFHFDATNDGKCDVCGYVMFAPVCNHEVTYAFTIEANCSAEGLKTVICADCEEVISEEVLAKNDNHFFYNGVCMLCGESDECKHTYEVVKTLDASCTLPAYVWEKCTKCGNEKNGEVGAPNPKAHTYEVVKSLDATCTEPAYVWYECSECGAEKNGEVGEATGKHTYEVVKSLDATCTLPAYVWYECSVCGAEKNGEVGAPNPKAHTYEVVKSLDATCTEPAYVWYECSECGAEKNGEVGEATGFHFDATNDGKCDVCGYVMIVPVCHHELTYAFTVEANCSAEGLKTVICVACEEVVAEEVLAKNDNHFFHNDVCLLCGKKD